MLSYVISGLSVVSDVALPGLIALPDWPTEPQVRIQAGRVPAGLADAVDRGPNWQLSPTRFVIDVPGIVRMMMIEGRELVFAIDAGVDLADAAIFISSTGFGILLQQRGLVVLHASAVRVGGQAVLFCGPSGAGKSTLAAALVDAGYDLVTDDFCGIAIDRQGVPWAQPDGRQLRLWQNAIDRLSLGARKAAPVRTRIEKFYVEPRAAIATPLPLAALYVLRDARPPILPGIERPTIVDGALLVRGNAYRPQMVRRMGQEGLYFQAAATICRRAGVFTLSRPMDFSRMPMVIGWLEAHWANLGMIGRAA